MINNNDFDQEILGKIKENKISLTPRWHFLIKDYMVWIFGIISLIVGGLSFSVIIYLVKFNDWGIYQKISDSFLGFIFLTLPYFWIAFLGLFTFLVYLNFKNTKKGYRYSLPFILMLNIMASILLGSLFFGIGIGRAIDDVLGERAPFYAKLFNRQINYWSQPNEGRLAGLVVSLEDDFKFVLFDTNKKEWWIIADNTYGEKVVVGRPIRVIGSVLSQNEFSAKEIFPAGVPGGGFFRRHKSMHFPELREKFNLREQMMGEGEASRLFKKFPDFEEERNKILGQKGE